jgi:hypothetical protein
LPYHHLFPHLKTKDGESRVRLSWHTLNDDERGNPLGSAFPDGRGYFAVDEKRLSLEWHFKPWPHSIGISLSFDGNGDNEVGFSIRVPFMQLYFSYEGGLYRLPERTIEIRWNDGGFWWSLWHSSYEWKSGTPKWRSGFFDVADFFLGRQQYSSVNLQTVETVVPLPEGPYPATVKLNLDTWKRPRWPWPQTLRRADVETHKPMAIPGKGENSWDCEDDAVFSTYLVASSVGEAVGKVVGSVLKTRHQRGGRNWMPEVGE